MSILIQNTKAYVGEHLTLTSCHVYVDNEGVMSIIDLTKGCLNEEQLKAEIILNGEKLMVMPAFSDIHVHFREPGFEQKETLETGQIAAIRGGVTQVCTMPNTKPPIDRVERLIHYQNLIGKKILIDILPSVAITLNQEGEAITDLEKLAELGAVAYTDDGRTVMSEEILKQSLKISQTTQKVVMTHSEDHELAKAYPDKPYPPEVESEIVERDIRILENYGGKLHIAHLSTEASLEAVKRGKEKELNVTCEVSPHHLYFDSEKLEFQSAKYKVNPPLRNEINRQALIKGVKEGHIDAIASDHAPHEEASKSTNYQNGAYGFTGIETMFSVVNTVFKEADIPMQTLIQMMSINPRKILGQATAVIENGAKANFVCIDADQEWTVQTEDIHSKSKNSPWIGQTLTGKVVHLVKNEKLLLKGGNVHVS